LALLRPPPLAYIISKKAVLASSSKYPQANTTQQNSTIHAKANYSSIHEKANQLNNSRKSKPTQQFS